MNKLELTQTIFNIAFVILLVIILSDLIIVRNDIDELKDWLYLITKILLGENLE